MGDSFDNHKHSQVKMALWSRRILDCKSSGLTISEWCINNSVDARSYWRWHKILKDQYTEYCGITGGSEPEFYEVGPADSAVVMGKAVATIRIGALSADIYTGNTEIIAAICRVLKSC